MGRKITDLTEEEFRVWTQKKLKFLESQIGDQWEKIGDIDDRNTQVVDEATDRAGRAQRAVRRLRKVFDVHQHPHSHKKPTS